MEENKEGTVTEKQCLYCKTTFTKKEHDRPSYFLRRKFCSKSCASKYPKYPKIKTHKRCRGLLHPEGVMLPLSEFYPIKDKRWPNTELYQSQCKACQLERNGYTYTKNSGHIPLYKITPIFDKLYEKYGSMDAMCDATGISRSTFSSIKNKHQKTIHKKTVVKLVRAL